MSLPMTEILLKIKIDRGYRQFSSETFFRNKFKGYSYSNYGRSFDSLELKSHSSDPVPLLISTPGLKAEQIFLLSANPMPKKEASEF